MENRTEKAILDLFTVNEKLLPFLSKIVIDVDRNFCLSNFAQPKKIMRVIETDHNGLIVDMELKVERRKPERRELFNRQII